MGEIIPRWEWRTFAKNIELKLDLAKYEKTRHVESAEVYVLSTIVDENPKIRDDKMDVKSLQQVNEDGLEQWKPIMKVSFPISAGQLREVYKIYRFSPPELKGNECSFAGFIELAKNNKRLMAIDVVKIRDLYDVDGCIVESATVKADGQEFKTVAAEDPDPAKVKATVEKLGLWGRENINYVQALKRIRKKEL